MAYDDGLGFLFNETDRLSGVEEIHTYTLDEDISNENNVAKMPTSVIVSMFPESLIRSRLPRLPLYSTPSPYPNKPSDIGKVRTAKFALSLFCVMLNNFSRRESV